MEKLQNVGTKSEIVPIQECLYIRGRVCSTSKQGGPKAHNLLYVNSPPQTQGGCETNLRLSFVNQSTKASLKM